MHDHRRLTTRIAALSALCLLFLLTACGGAPRVDWTLHVTGDVASPLTLSFKELAGMPQTELDEILMEKSLGEDEVGSWSGPSLAHILEQAGAPASYASITAQAADGYAVEISYDETQDAIVALKQNEEWIAGTDDDHGPIRLVCPHTPANRWVFQLETLQINE
jgi:DMSO/TMAO reductase YedYZ molybdopterin-dependent catalytic subunit